jgi:hypothetical protein
VKNSSKQNRSFGKVLEPQSRVDNLISLEFDLLGEIYSKNVQCNHAS